MNKKTLLIYILVILFLIIVTSLFSLTHGLLEISIIDAVKILLRKVSYVDNTVLVIKYIRFPRIVVSCIAGSGLAASGCVFQSILKNPLADSFTLGISAGSVFGVAVALISGIEFSSVGFLTIPIFAFLGAMISVLIVYFIGIYKDFNSNKMILSGVFVNYIFSSIVILMFILSPINNVQFAFGWLIGSLSQFDEKLIPYIAFIVLLGIIILSLLGNIINVLSLDESKIKTLGINVEKNVKFFFIITSFITATTVSLCGIIGFIGFLIPNMVKKIVGNNNQILIPSCAFTGAFFLLLSDTLSRIIFTSILIPVGVITNIIGGFFFLFLQFFRSKKNIL
ncbi:MAG: iron ABC transporter permease [Endomicrobium sp.]|jgi:iron complex transport system permease protein|nr:iron ABC transporter permease [Endomicrobium sp.]